MAPDCSHPDDGSIAQQINAIRDRWHTKNHPFFQAHFGFSLDAPEIGFFIEHAQVDLEHSRRQIEVCEDAVRLRWESITDLYRRHISNDDALLPPGVAN